MTFGLISWLKTEYPALSYEVPLWYPSKEQPDQREWLVTNGLGGYAASTMSGAHRRRYHGMLVSALAPPGDRHVILSRVEEIVTVDGATFELATNHWASGVVSPTGYKYIESFSILPTPTWVYELDGHYLIKQLALDWHTNTVYFGYHWLPDPDREVNEASIVVRFLTGFRSIHGQIEGSSDDRYPQFVSPNHSVIVLNESHRRLCLSWSHGEYEAQKQWWWDFHWPEESARALPDREDLYLVGHTTSKLLPETELAVSAGLDKAIDKPDCRAVVRRNLERQNAILQQANFPKHQQKIELLALACDQFLTSEDAGESGNLFVMEGYPWSNESGRAAMIALPGLTLSTRRFPEAKRILHTYSKRMVNGLMPNHLLEDESTGQSGRLEYGAADITLWWGWALHHYLRSTRDVELIKEQLPLMLDAAKHYARGTGGGIKVDPSDGLLTCSRAQHEFTWMNTKIAGIPITPRSGKAVEICALWYNYLKTLLFFAQTVSLKDPFIADLQHMSELCGGSMQKFWNADSQCLYDVIEPTGNQNSLPVTAIRPNQLFAVSLPHRAFSIQQEKAILVAVESELLAPHGLRSLAATDPGYQGAFGCGFAHADQYHRDLSYHNGMVWTWLLGAYCDAVVNVHGVVPKISTRIGVLLQPLIAHLVEEAGVGSIAEIFDGSRPHQSRGCYAHAVAVAETMRWLNWQLRR